MALAAALASRDTPSVRLPRRADTRPRRPPRPVTYIGAIGQYIKPTPSATPGAPRFWEIQRKRSEVLLLGENKAVSDGRQPVFFPLSLVGVILRRRNASATNSKTKCGIPGCGEERHSNLLLSLSLCLLLGRPQSVSRENEDNHMRLPLPVPVAPSFLCIYRSALYDTQSASRRSPRNKNKKYAQKR